MQETYLQTLNDLQLPTMSLVEKFCDTPEEVKTFFAGMLAVYENNPTQDNLKRIADKIKSRDSREQKQVWLQEELKSVNNNVKYKTAEKYIKQKNSVPNGMPSSGELLTFLDYVPRHVKDELLNAQAAARILSHLQANNKDIKATLICYDEQNNPLEAKSFLNKPFASTIQRMEQITDFLCAYKNNETELGICKKHNDMLEAIYLGKDNISSPEININGALNECQKLAIQTLQNSAKNISQAYPNASKRLADLAESYNKTDNSPVNYALVAHTAKDALNDSAAYFGTIISGADMPVSKTQDSFSSQEVVIAQKILSNRLEQINLNQIKMNSSKQGGRF